jgi:hypothetical protein
MAKKHFPLAINIFIRRWKLLVVIKEKPHLSFKKWGLIKSPSHNLPPGNDWRARIYGNNTKAGGNVKVG